jgi:hypothetical protein
VGVQFAEDFMFNPLHGSRPSVPHYAIVVSDGPSDNMNDTIDEVLFEFTFEFLV